MDSEYSIYISHKQCNFDYISLIYMYVSSWFDHLVMTGHVFSGSVSFSMYCDHTQHYNVLSCLMDLHCFEVGVAGVRLSVLIHRTEHSAWCSTAILCSFTFIAFRNRVLYGFMLVTIYIYIYHHHHHTVQVAKRVLICVCAH